jgi:diketogulonate reductase-like aldo/keto reductase
MIFFFSVITFQPLNMLNQNSTITLSNGIKMPVIGLGTSHHGGYSHSAMVFALKDVGYTLIDTARRYGSEEMIGEDIKASGASRKNLFVTTKLWPADYGYEETKKAFMTSLTALALNYVDLYLMHWPDCPTWCKDKKETRRETWRAMEELFEAGKCKAIGVSNFLVEHLEEMLTNCRVKPHVNQIEFHPYCQPKRLMTFCREKGIVLGGYGPLAKGEIMSNQKLRTPFEPIAKRHGKSIAQVCIRWCLQHSVVVIPKSTKAARLLENIDVFDFQLDSEEMKTIDALSELVYYKSTWEPNHLPLYQDVISRKPSVIPSLVD